MDKRYGKKRMSKSQLILYLAKQRIGSYWYITDHSIKLRNTNDPHGVYRGRKVYGVVTFKHYARTARKRKLMRILLLTIMHYPYSVSYNDPISTVETLSKYGLFSSNILDNHITSIEWSNMHIYCIAYDGYIISNDYYILEIYGDYWLFIKRDNVTLIVCLVYDGLDDLQSLYIYVVD